MERSDIRILIIEDDNTLVQALASMVKKMGFTVTVASNPTDAMNQFRIQGAQLILVDLLLPTMSGVDLAIKLRKSGAEETPMILMSGIYKDKIFVRDALRKTGAVEFFDKPLDMDKLREAIDKCLESIVDEELSPMDTTFVDFLSPQEKINLIDGLNEIEGRDIPWLCCLLLNPSTSGTLSLTGTQGHTLNANIRFNKGKIAHVDSNSPKSFFGSLIVEKGLVTLEQLNEVLQTPGVGRIGERLVKMNLLSPHVIDVVNAEQSALRLSQLVGDFNYEVSFHPGEVEGEAGLDTDQFCELLSTWIDSKFPANWLQNRYLKWQDKGVLKSDHINNLAAIKRFEPLRTWPKMVQQFEGGNSVDQLLNLGHYSGTTVYKVFHLLMLTESIKLKTERRELDEASQMARLNGIWKHMQTQDYFGILGLKRNARGIEIKKTYYDLAKIFHPDKLGPNTSPKHRDVAQKVFGLITKAHETLSDDSNRKKYIQTLELGHAEKILAAEGLLEAGRALLKSGKATDAKAKFEEAIKLNPPTSELLIYYCWARLVTVDKSPKPEEELSQITESLNQIPPEDRHNSTYYYVRAILLNILGDLPVALKMVNQALALSPKFTEAERLRRIIDGQVKSQKQVSILHSDLKDVVGLLFKKK